MPKDAFDFKFAKRKRHKRRLIAKVFLLFLFFSGFLLLIGWFLSSSFFRFNNIDVQIESENEDLPIMEFLKRESKINFLANILGEDHFFAWSSQIPKNKLSALPEIEAISINKNYQENKLEVKVMEKEPFGVWCFKKNSPPSCFWFNEKGILFRSSPIVSGNLIFVISDFEQNTKNLGDSILPEESLSDNFISILRTISDANLRPQTISLSNLELQEVNVKLQEGVEILFSLRFPSRVFTEFLKSLSSRPDFQKINYVDLRTENRAYYQ